MTVNTNTRIRHELEELQDGLILHGFNSPRPYILTWTLTSSESPIRSNIYGRRRPYTTKICVGFSDIFTFAYINLGLNFKAKDNFVIGLHACFDVTFVQIHKYHCNPRLGKKQKKMNVRTENFVLYTVFHYCM